jgi:hypothetical protein
MNSGDRGIPTTLIQQMSEIEMDRKSGAHGSGPSWGLMLALLFGAILVAIGIAWWMIAPYVHQLRR